MKKLIENWVDGLSYLITDDCISFYTFYTVILAECAYLRVFHESEIALPITAILLGYMLNVIVFAWLKGETEGTRLELISAVLYTVVFCALFAVGCIIDAKLTIVLTVILLVTTAIWIGVRSLQDSGSLLNIYMWVFSQIIVIGGPFVAFAILFAKIPSIPAALKVIIPALYLICSPLIAFYEDDTAACNIFELAYDVTWDKEFENYLKKNKDL